MELVPAAFAARGSSVIAGAPTPIAAAGMLANLRTIANVTILRAGENWHLSTGDATFTPSDLAAAVAALDDPAIHTPILKLGHSDPRPGFDGQPAFGKLINLRVENEGMDLVADIAGVPQWMADAMPTSWPTRSIEGYVNYQTATGKTHSLVITGLALLAEGPAIETLEDLPLALGTMVAAETTPPPVGQRFAGQPSTQPVMASVTYEDVRRAFYDAVDDIKDLSNWAWIRELVIDPPQLVVDDDDNGLWRVAYSVNGNEVTFSDPEQVRVEYVAAAAAPRRDGVTVFASREQSVQPANEGEAMDLSILRQSLGLADSTPDAEVLRLASERLSPPAATAPVDTPTPTPTPEPVAETTDAPTATAPTQTATPPTATVTTPPPATTTAPAAPVQEAVTEVQVTPPVAPTAFQPPPGTRLVDEEYLVRMEQGVAAGIAASARQLREDCERYVDSVIAAGRMSPQNTKLRNVIEAAWKRNPAEADAIVENLSQAFPVSEIGHAAGGIEASAAAQYAQWDEQDNALWGQMAPMSAGKAGA